MQIEQFNKIDTVSPGNYHYKIKLSNVGNELLKINSISTTCGCTVSYKDSMEILSNQFDFLELDIDLKHSNALKEIIVIIESNDLLSPIQNINLNFYILNDLKFYPKQLPSYSRMNIGDEITLKVQIKNFGTDLITIYKPYLADIDVGEILSVLPDVRIIKGKETIELLVKMKILKKEQIITKLIIPTSSIHNSSHEYLFVLN
ncbi:MAG: hypothetical protein RO257_16660 [Candidatus Kapabacteria bacterium]|nr:hypothetical protein [Candidatus Kapabacteria bacterium]